MKYVSINGHTIRSNSIHGKNDPPIRIAKSPSDQKPKYAHEIKILGDSRLIYDPEKAIIRCGARLVLIVDEVEIIK